MRHNARFWLGTTLALQIAMLAMVFVLALYALNTNGTLCAFKRDLEQRRDSSAEYLHSIETGARALPAGFSIADLKQTLAARESTLRSLSDLKCSP